MSPKNNGKQRELSGLQSPGYFGQFELYDAQNDKLTREKLASCFLPNEVIEGLTRKWKTLTIFGRIIIIDNETLCRRIEKIIAPAHKNALEWIERTTFDWAIASKLICERCGFSRITLEPTRNKYIEWIQIKTTSTQEEHLDEMSLFREKIRKLGLHYVENCLSSGPCHLVDRQILINKLRS